MREDSHYSPSEAVQEKIEKRDVRFAAILISLLGLTFFIIGSIAAGVVTFKGLEFYIKKCDNPAACMFQKQMEVPEPRLQDKPAQDLLQVKKEQTDALNGYAVLDPAAGIARIPVSRAMEMLAEKPDLFARIQEEVKETPQEKQEEKKAEEKAPEAPVVQA